MATPNGDVDTSTANERDKQRLLDAAREAEGGERQERDPEPDIEVEDERPPAEEPGDDDESGGALREEEPRQPREERRTNRYAEAQRALEEERARRMALEAHIAMTRQAPPVPQRSREELQAEAEDIYRRDLGAVQQARMDLQQVVRANKDTYTDEVHARVMAEDANLRILEANAQRRYMSRLDQAERPPQAPPPNPAVQVVVGRYQDVVKDALGMRYADTYYMEQKRKGTKLDEVELVEESMKFGRAKLRGETFSPATRERPKPTKNQQAKYTGTGSNSSAGAPAPSGKLTITKEQDKLAQKLYAHIPEPADRRRLYHKNVIMKRGA